MERWKKRAVELLTSLTFGSDDTPSVVPYTPSKIALPDGEDRFFKRSQPEKFGISSKRLYNMLCELENERRANIHNLMVLCNGEVICECSRDGYDVNMWHLSHSMSKSVTSMVVGLLVSDGLLDVNEKIVDIFPELEYKDKRFPQITVDHLLAMKSGSTFNEMGSITETKWTEAFFTSSLRFVPGTKFQYNSMNTYLLARIVDRRTECGFTEYARERLFEPLGIRNYFWEKSPEGTEKGGWGLYISAESFAKFGMLFLSGGEFFGKRVISEEWINQMGDTHAVSHEINGDFDYGYQTWVSRSTDEKLFNGMLGQDVWICPRNNIVAVINGGNNELFQESMALDILRHNLGGEINDELSRGDIRTLHDKERSFYDCRRWVRPKEKKKGFLYFLGLRQSKAYDERWDGILGSYAFGDNNVGVLPFIVRAMQNNLDSNLEKVTIRRAEDDVLLVVKESGEQYILRIGLYEYKTTVLNFRGEKYIAKAMGEVFVSADGAVEYRVDLIFPELPNTRLIRFKKTEDGKMMMKLIEIPNERIAENLLLRASELNQPLAFVVDVAERKFGEGAVANMIRSKFSPVLIGADMSMPGYHKFVDSENKRNTEESSIVRMVRNIVDRFFKDSPENSEGAKKRKKNKDPDDGKK